MRCPYCKSDDARVVDSRTAEGGLAVRRRRECAACERRWTTYERVEDLPLRVVKKDGARQAFDRAKILSGLLKACEKRPVSTDHLERITSAIERRVHELFEREVPTGFIGDLVMEELRGTDQVAYVRFASVYREFKDVREFLDELRPMIESGGAPDTADAAEDAS